MRADAKTKWGEEILCQAAPVFILLLAGHRFVLQDRAWSLVASAQPQSAYGTGRPISRFCRLASRRPTLTARRNLKRPVNCPLDSKMARDVLFIQLTKGSGKKLVCGWLTFKARDPIVVHYRTAIPQDMKYMTCRPCFDPFVPHCVALQSQIRPIRLY